MIYGIIGDHEASPKLVTAALDDQLDAHLRDNPGGEFWLVLGIRKPSPKIYTAIIEWALAHEIYCCIYSAGSYDNFTEVDEFHQRPDYSREVVNRLFKEPDTKMVYVLLGDPAEASVDVRRTIAYAVDSGIEVRDLSEAGLTLVGITDNPIQTKGSNMADETMTIEQAGEAADEGDDEAIEELTNLAGQYELDPDEYPTWAELAAAIKPLLAGSEEEVEDEEEAAAAAHATREDRDPPRQRGTKQLTQEELEETPVPELRVLARQLGVEGWEKNRSAKLIEGILEAQENGDGTRAIGAVTDDGEGVLLEGIAFDGISATALARGLRAFADALEG